MHICHLHTLIFVEKQKSTKGLYILIGSKIFGQGEIINAKAIVNHPQWNEDNPIHIIGHSMGGQTARMLQYLLSQEFYVDKETQINEASPLLGDIQNNWIKSITSISTPHDGTTLTEIVTKTIPFIQYFVGVAGVIAVSYTHLTLPTILRV